MQRTKATTALAVRPKDGCWRTVTVASVEVELAEAAGGSRMTRMPMGPAGNATSWLLHCAERTHPAVVPMLWLCGTLIYYGLVYSYAGGSSCCWSSDRELWGGIITYSLTAGVPGVLCGLQLPSLPGGAERTPAAARSRRGSFHSRADSGSRDHGLRHHSRHAVRRCTVPRSAAGTAGSGESADEPFHVRHPGGDVGCRWLVDHLPDSQRSDVQTAGGADSRSTCIDSRICGLLRLSPCWIC